MQGPKAVVSKSNSGIPYDAMIHLVSILYCRSIFHDFRMPVEILYPTLAASYLTIIQSPMDHGTLLVKLLKNEIKSIDDFRRCLQLVHNNALQFNEGMINIVDSNLHIYILSLGHSTCIFSIISLC